MNRQWLRATIASAALVALAFGAVAVLAPPPLFLWNASASAPIGLYRITVGRRPTLGDYVAIDPPDSIAALLAARDYVPRGVPLLKRIAAVEGALVCRSGAFVTIDGRPAARALSHDRLGRLLPLWFGCRRLHRGEIFLLNAAPDSFDSRYFGPILTTGLIGTAHPLLTRDAPGAPLRWRPRVVFSSSTRPSKEHRK